MKSDWPPSLPAAFHSRSLTVAARLRSFGLVAAALILAGCGRYADFALPPPREAIRAHFRIRGASRPGSGPRPRLRFARRSESFGGAPGRPAEPVLGIRWPHLDAPARPPPKTASPGANWDPCWRPTRAPGRDPTSPPTARLLFSGGCSGIGTRPARGPAARGPGGLRETGARGGSSRPVLEPGPYMSWDERGVADPWVMRVEPYFYLYYLGQDRAGRQRLGVARSRDGIGWEKLRSSPTARLGRRGRLRRERPGRAGGVEFARLLLDALHRPRSGRASPPGPGALSRRRPLAEADSAFSGAETWDSRWFAMPASCWRATPCGCGLAVATRPRRTRT